MPALTRRLFRENRYRRWDIFDGDVCVGTLTEIHGTEGRMLWEWCCGCYRCELHQMTAGKEDTFDEAKARFQEAWEQLQPQITPAMRDAWRYQEAFTAWKYAMRDAKCHMPTQTTDGRSRCFCGTEITIKGAPEHIRAAHMGKP